ncbi:gustatory receptor for sugar taste 43a-like isoform X1 [Neodiprion lecontei]|uniref:Gustatory receptor n=1 Tax=Neodiprion lecontei TaxID=441921 RepID=A0ABM3FNV5_NEOLC|nr:gustatory receptor for sugar taste 43a-like isoform X1 [Neodiprion pinetum]XP_046589705.1 gustatory receptor for sugar taste 43a-like isoform X1 [Neodiprion lecontei]
MQITARDDVDKQPKPVKHQNRRKPEIVQNIVKSDLYQALFPAYHFSKVCGLLPVSFTKLNSGRYCGRLNYLEVTYSVGLLLLLICAEFWGLWRELHHGWENSTRMKSKTAVVVTCSDIMAIAGLAAISILGMPLRWSKIQNIMDRLVEVDEKLTIVSPKKTRRFCIIIMSVTLIYFNALSIIDYYVWDVQAKKVNKIKDKGAINYVPLYFLYVPVLMMEIQIALAAYNLGQRFARLNKCLGNMLKTERFANFFSNDLIPESLRHVTRYDLESLLQRFLLQRSKKSVTIGDFNEHGQFRAVIRGDLRGEPLFRIRKISDIELIRSGSNNSAEMIYDLVTVHSSLSDTVLVINSVFGLPALVAVLTCLLHLIITPYFLILEANGDHNEMFLVVQLMWCIGHVGRLLIVVQPCYAASVQAKGTAVLVSQLLSVNWEPDVRKQLEIFSLQLLHRPLEFSACGLCSLDRSLVTSIAGAVTTYLVILIQFQKDDDTKETNTILKNATMLLRNATTLHNATAKQL